MIFGDSPTMANGRYVPSVHAILQPGNLYMFTMHNLIRFIDPTGLFAEYTHLNSWLDMREGWEWIYSLAVMSSFDRNTTIVGIETARGIGVQNFTIGVNGTHLRDGELRVRTSLLNDAFSYVQLSPGLIHTPMRDSVTFGLWVAEGYGVIPGGMWLLGKRQGQVKMWVDFDPLGPREQDGVNPFTLIPARQLDFLTAANMRSAVKYAGHLRIIVDRKGEVWQGHHRLLYAMRNKFPANTQIGH